MSLLCLSTRTKPALSSQAIQEFCMLDFEDQPKLAENAKSVKEAMLHYRMVRDKISVFVKPLPGSLQGA